MSISIQRFLADLSTNIRRPGALKSLAGQLAIAYGTRLALDAASEGEERLEAANLALEKVDAQLVFARSELKACREASLHTLRQAAVDLIRAGDLDDEVEHRAAVLDRERAAVAVDAVEVDGPPETIGAVRDLPGEEPSPPCVDPTCRLDWAHDGPHSPAIPPRMNGGYLRAVADRVPATVPDVPDAQGDEVDGDGTDD